LNHVPRCLATQNNLFGVIWKIKNILKKY
jgi:hypothetical protein